jgi:hypothetical protein
MEIDINDIEEIEDEKILADIAENHENPDARLFAVLKIKDIELLARITENDEDEGVRITAENLMKNLKAIAIRKAVEEDPTEMIDSLKNISDYESFVEKYDPAERMIAVQYIKDIELLTEIAKKDEDPILKVAIVSCASDKELLSEIAENDEDSQIRDAAQRKLEELNE